MILYMDRRKLRGTFSTGPAPEDRDMPAFNRGNLIFWLTSGIPVLTPKVVKPRV